MRRLVYVSTPVLPVVDAILDIVRVSEPRNTASGVSGLLLYGAGRYAQMLEGGEGELKTTFGRIRADWRHAIVWESWIEAGARAVAPDLPMGYLSDDEALRLGGAGAASALASPRREDMQHAVHALLAIGAAKYPSAITVRA